MRWYFGCSAARTYPMTYSVVGNDGEGRSTVHYVTACHVSAHPVTCKPMPLSDPQGMGHGGLLLQVGRVSLARPVA
jgi:hypothetical protein